MRGAIMKLITYLSRNKMRAVVYLEIRLLLSQHRDNLVYILWVDGGGDTKGANLEEQSMFLSKN